MYYRSVTIGFVLLILMGCFQTQVPNTPDFATETQKTCGQQCLAMHSRCGDACSVMFDQGSPESQKMKCRHNCNSVLRDCYRTCQ